MGRWSWTVLVTVPLSLGASLTVASSIASAQVKLPPDHCEGALFIADQIKQRYQISPRLQASFDRFRLSECDIDTSFERDTKVDVTAFAEFRLRFEAWKICSADPMRRRCL